MGEGLKRAFAAAKATREFYVEIRPFTEDEGDPGFRRMGPMSERKAEKVDRGASINLNHEKYYTRIVQGTALRGR